MELSLKILAIIVAGVIANTVLRIASGTFLFSAKRPIFWLLSAALTGFFLVFLSALFKQNPTIPFWVCILTIFINIERLTMAGGKNATFRAEINYFRIGMALFIGASVFSYIMFYGGNCTQIGLDCSRVIAL